MIVYVYIVDTCHVITNPITIQRNNLYNLFVESSNQSHGQVTTYESNMV
jgi:hypothetical protein